MTLVSCLSPHMTIASGIFCALLAGMWRDVPHHLDTESGRPGPLPRTRDVPAVALRTLAVASLLLAFAGLRWILPGTFGPLVRLDSLGLAWQGLFYAGAVPAALLLAVDDEVPVALLLGSVLGMALLAVSDQLLLLFIGFELMSIPAYLLVARKGSPGSLEAAIKYFFAGGLAGSAFLMGLALHYAGSGDLSLAASPGPLGEGGMALMGSAALFKVGAVPLQFWLPDVYEAAEPEVAGFLSTSMKAAGVLLLMRLCALAPHSVLAGSLPFLGAITMLFGAFLATRQDNLQRLLAYSSIAHVGTLLLGIGAWATQGAPREGAAPLFFYLAVTLFMSNGSFAFLKVSGLRTRRELYGYARSQPALAGLFAVILLALAGIPPTGGFLAKLLIFWEAVKCGFYVPLAAAGLAAVVALSYYLSLIQAMYFEEPEGKAPEPGAGGYVVWALAAGALAMGLAPRVLVLIAGVLTG